MYPWTIPEDQPSDLKMIRIIAVVLLVFSLVDQSQAQIEIRHDLESLTLEEGNSLSLNCVILDPLFDTIKWYKDKEQLSNNAELTLPEIYPEYRVTHSSTEKDGLQQYTLVVLSLMKENDGIYKCKGSRGDSRPTTNKLEINVLYVPDPIFPLCDYDYLNHESPSLICNSEKGNPLKPLTWKKTNPNNATANSALDSLNVNVDKFHHDQTATISGVPPPDFTDDEFVCMFVEEESRNCTLSYERIYESFSPPNISPSLITVDINSSVTVSCTPGDALSLGTLEVTWVTFPPGVEIDVTEGYGYVTFPRIPEEASRIRVWCNLTWGALGSIRSEIALITVNHTNGLMVPTVTPEPVTTIQTMSPTSLTTPTPHEPTTVPRLTTIRANRDDSTSSDAGDSSTQTIGDVMVITTDVLGIQYSTPLTNSEPIADASSPELPGDLNPDTSTAGRASTTRTSFEATALLENLPPFGSTLSQMVEGSAEFPIFEDASTMTPSPPRDDVSEGTNWSIGIRSTISIPDRNSVELVQQTVDSSIHIQEQPTSRKIQDENTARADDVTVEKTSKMITKKPGNCKNNDEEQTDQVVPKEPRPSTHSEGCQSEICVFLIILSCCLGLGMVLTTCSLIFIIKRRHRAYGMDI